MRTRVHLDDAPLDDLLATYLRDHLAGAAGGDALARRAAGTVAQLDPEAGSALERLARDIGEQRRELRRCARALGIRRPRLRELGAHLTERLGRLKLNGQFLGTSAMSPVFELDLLVMAVSGQARGWRTIATFAPDGVPDDMDLEALEQRAIEQREELEVLQDRVLGRLLGSGQD